MVDPSSQHVEEDDYAHGDGQDKSSLGEPAQVGSLNSS